MIIIIRILDIGDTMVTTLTGMATIVDSMMDIGMVDEDMDMVLIMEITAEFPIVQAIRGVMPEDANCQEHIHHWVIAGQTELLVHHPDIAELEQELHQERADMEVEPQILLLKEAYIPAEHLPIIVTIQA